jgi:hypothetical protein
MLLLVSESELPEAVVKTLDVEAAEEGISCLKVVGRLAPPSSSEEGYRPLWRRIVLLNEASRGICAIPIAPPRRPNVPAEANPWEL